MPKSNRPLGNHQTGVLRSLKEHGSWSMNCGWHWGGYLKTRRLLEGLCKRGLVAMDGQQYVITDAGRAEVRGR